MAVWRVWLQALAVVLITGSTATPASAQQVERLVLLKADGLAQNIIDEFINQRDPRTGKSVLPWIDHVFYQDGTRLANFYVRGTSLSGPSWSMLDTGQQLQIKGNVEYDRYTQHPYDYLNFIPFWLGNAARRRGDMWGTNVLDELRMPLLLDAYDYDARLQSFQLFQRGSRWMTLRKGLEERFTSRSKKQIFDEWQIGIETRGIVGEQLERELIAALANPRMKYLDYYTTDFDHATHHNRDRATHLAALQELDAVVGRLWTAISRSQLADRTALVLVSDHGVNSDPRVYSQGFNLVNLLTGKAGGAHHVITKRRLMKDYSIKGIYPLVPLITTTSPESTYLKDQQDVYPTALVDFDGNERASIHLRDATLNTIHILLRQLARRDLTPAIRRAVEVAVLETIDRHRAAWTQTSSELKEELDALRASTAPLRARVIPPADKKRSSRKSREPVVQLSSEESEQQIRDVGLVETWTREDLEYSAYVRTLDNLLALSPATLSPATLAREFDITQYIAPGAMGERNTLYDLQHYIAGPAPSGMVLHNDGTLDMERSFTRVDYFPLLTGARVRNNVQGAVGSSPIDMVTLHLPCGALDDASLEADLESCLWINGGSATQALLLSRTDANEGLQLRYLPVANLTQDAGGRIHFERIAWRADLPMRLWEDPHLRLPAGAPRDGWLDAWHSDEEWFAAIHLTQYSNGLIGLHQQLAVHPWPALDSTAPDLDDAERLRRRFRQRQRALVEPDLLILASDHWNFDVRGFNPGGNHGSFFRPSTHATFMVAGGRETAIPKGLEVQRPYDSLSFVPTMLALTGRLEGENQPDAELRARGFQPFPGRLVRELMAAPSPAGADSSASP